MISKNGLGVSVIVLHFILTTLGVELEPGTVEKWVEAVIVVGSGILLVWNQLMRDDVSWFWLKK